jgi:hypothetical protein
MDNKSAEISIRGAISEGDLKYLRRLYVGDNIGVDRYHARGASIGPILHEIQIIFHDFTIINFARDYLLVEIINKIRKSIFPLLHKGLEYFKKKSKKIQTIVIVIIVNCRHHQVRLEFVLPFDQVETFVQNLDQLLTDEFLVDFCNKDKIVFTLSDGSITIKEID